MKKFKDLTKKQVCKVCFKEFCASSFQILLGNSDICDECYDSFPKIFETEYVDGVRVNSIYEYKSPLDSLIYQYKELLDIELSNVFLSRIKFYLKCKFYNYNLVLLPSSENAIKKRGFNHLYEIFKNLDLPIIENLLYKSNDSTQKELNYLSRMTHRGFINMNNNIDIKNKNILLVDDVFSTGATLKEAIKLVKNREPCRIKALILCRNKNMSKFV